jgi:outer membrane receptor protein involved in Fe transport
MGVFGEAELKVSERATVIAGLRYQQDRQKRVGDLTARFFVIPVNFVGTFHNWLPKVSFAYDLTRALRVGAMVEKAYNPGGTTIRVDTSRADNFAAESLWDYELFARGDWGAVSAIANVFYYDIKNAQRSQDIAIFTPTGGKVGFANMFNVPKARSYGAEGQLSWHQSKTLSVSAEIGLLRTKVVRSSHEVPQIQGNEFDRSPHFSGSVAVDWGATKGLRLSAQVRHHSPYFSDAENRVATRVGSATIADARAEYRLKSVSLFAQVRNLFDTMAMLDLDSASQGEAEDPRTFAVGVEARF